MESPPALKLEQQQQRTLAAVAGDFADLPADVAADVAHVHNGRMTDARLKGAIVRMRGAGVPVRRVCDVLGCSPHTVQVAEREVPELLASLKERQALSWDRVQVLCSESLEQAALDGRLKPAEMGLTGAIAGTKSAELRGEASLRIEVTHHDAHDPADLVARAKALRGRIIDAQSITEKVEVVDV